MFFPSQDLNKNISVKAFLETDIENLFWLLLSLTAFTELNQLQANIQQFRLNMEGNDLWTYIWGSQAFLVQTVVNWHNHNFTMVQMDVAFML